MREDAPVFVAGLDHSGKTVLRGALGAHPRIHMVRHVELWTRLHALHAAGPRGRRRLLHALTEGRAARLGLDRSRLDRAASGGDFTALVTEIGRQLCERAGTSRWGLQEALLEFRATDVLRALPEARIVQVVRDPRERYAAMLAAGAVGRGGLGAETAAWIASARAAQSAAASAPGRFRIVSCESLIANPEATLRELCAFIGEPYSDALVAAVQAPLTPSTRLPAIDVAFIQERAGSELCALNYPLLSTDAGAGILPRLTGGVRWQLGRLAWRRRTRHLDASFA